MNKEFKNYIGKMHQGGFSDGQIKEELKKAGWSDEQIRQYVGEFLLGEKPKVQNEISEITRKSPNKILGKLFSNIYNTKRMAIVVLIFIAISVSGIFASLATRAWDPGWNLFRLQPEEVMEKSKILMYRTTVLEVDHKINYKVKRESKEESLSVNALDVMDKRAEEGDIKYASYANLLQEGVEDKYSFSIAMSAIFLDVFDKSYFKLKAINIYEDESVMPEYARGITSLNAVKIILEPIVDTWVLIDEKDTFLPISVDNINYAHFIFRTFSDDKFYSVAEELPDQKIDGEKFYHYKLQVAPEAFNETTMGNFTEEWISSTHKEDAIYKDFLNKPIYAEVWISKKSNLIKKVIFKKDGELDFGTYNVFFSVDTSADILYPEQPAKSIVIPSNFKTLDEVFGEPIDLKENEFVLFSDPKFEIQLPRGWFGDAGYSPGNSVVFFYSPEDIIDRRKTAFMTIGRSLSNINVNINLRIDEKLSRLENSNVLFDILSDEIREFGGDEGRVIELVVSDFVDLDKRSHIISASIKYGFILYYIEVTAPEKYWYLYEGKIMDSILSFRPKNSSL